MDMNERINRINELYHKSQSEGLSDEEKAEQKKLRQEYIDSVRNSLKGQLDNVDIVEKDGSIVNVGEKVRKKKELVEIKQDNSVIERKNALRKKMLATRSALSETEVMNKSTFICQHLYIDDAYKNAKLILIYASYNNEADTFGIVKKALADGKRVAFPKCELSDGIPSIDFYEVNNTDDLISGYKGIPEPNIEGKELKKISEKADLCIVPGVAFDKVGNRIGYGKGFYDRFIEKQTADTYIGIGFDFQVVKKIPVEETDKALDMIITEERVYVCK